MQIEYSNWRRAGLMALLAASMAGGVGRAEGKIARKNPDATPILKQMAQAERDANYSAIQTIERVDAPAVEVRVWRLGRQRHLEYRAPAVNRGDVLVDDGRNTWLYHRAENAAIQTRSQVVRETGARAEKGRFQSRYQMAGEARIDNRAAWIVDVLRSEGGVARRLWIDKATKLRLSTQFFGASGQNEGRTTLRDLKIGGVSESRFRWQPPQGAQVVRTMGTLYSQFAPARQSAPWLRYPRFLPPGYAFESAIIDNAKGEAWLRYADATRRFSLFQQRATSVSSVEKAPQQVEGGWYRNNRGSRQLLVGVPQNLANRVLDSVK